MAKENLIEFNYLYSPDANLITVNQRIITKMLMQPVFSEFISVVKELQSTTQTFLDAYDNKQPGNRTVTKAKLVARKALEVQSRKVGNMVQDFAFSKGDPNVPWEAGFPIKSSSHERKGNLPPYDIKFRKLTENGTVRISWHTPPDGAYLYELQISYILDGEWQPSVFSRITHKDFSDMKINQMFYVRIRTINRNCELSVWSPIRAIFVDSNALESAGEKHN